LWRNNLLFINNSYFFKLTLLAWCMAKSEVDYNVWNGIKKQIENREKTVFFHEREVWWCSLGINIGIEIDGKNEYYKRPALIIRKFNNEMAWIVPLTSRIKDDRFHSVFRFNGRSVAFKLTQIRTISRKRLLRKAGTISEPEFASIKNRLLSLF